MAARGKSKAPVASGQIATFEAYQAVVARTDETKKRIVSLLGLVGEIGDLHSMIKKLIIQEDSPTFRDELREEFGDVLWYLTSLALLYKLSLSEIATANVAKAEALYSEGTRAVFDAKYPADERFPRQFTVSFIQKPVERGVYVRITVNDVVIGDALTDNAHIDDGYRFHDAFHLAYAAVLGWSPVLRAILRRKRKSNSKIDEVEDGARAATVEEAVSIFVFNHAPERNWYADPAAIDIGLLKTIRRLTNGLEVRTASAKQWRSAIHQGFKVFSALRDNMGGSVDVDLDKQLLTYRPPDNAAMAR